jgi:hypothetical protein
MLTVSIVFLLPLLVGFTDKSEPISMWDRMCAACHDGQTVLNGKVVISKEQMKEKYKTIDELVKAMTCDGPPCMNILKHDEKLVRRVGEEIGIKNIRKK